MTLRHVLQQAWWAGVEAVNGCDLVTAELRQGGYQGISHVLAIGKAASSMMWGAAEHLQPFKGLCVTKYGHGDRRLNAFDRIETIESAHPFPDNNSLLAGQKALDFVMSCDANDALLVLVSGGASSLVDMLPETVSLDDLVRLTKQMLGEDKTIAEINQQRSQLSLLKNGKLLNSCQAGYIRSLAISDVRGDDIWIIGSGIGACNLTGFSSRVIGSNAIARSAITAYFSRKRINVVHNAESLYGEVNRQAANVAHKVIEGPPGAYIFGGEPSVVLPDNPGRGGRNQALALSLAKHISSRPGIVALVAGSDGSDGPTDAAGGIVDGKTYTEQAALAIARADSGDYLEKNDALFVTGPTGTNVMDIALVIKTASP